MPMAQPNKKKKKQCCVEFHVFNPFLQESDVAFIPTSGLSGENLITRSQSSELTGWYKGLCLLEQIGKTTTILILIHYKLDSNYYLEFFIEDSDLCENGQRLPSGVRLPVLELYEYSNWWQIFLV